LIAELRNLTETEGFGGRYASMCLARDVLWTGGSAREATALALRALADEWRYSEAADRGVPMYPAIEVLALAGCHQEIAPRLAVALSSARRRGSETGVLVGTTALAAAAFARGDLRSAAEHASFVVELTSDGRLTNVRPLALATLLDALIDRGELEQAQELIANAALPGAGSSEITLALARGRLQLALGRARDARTSAISCGKKCEQLGLRSAVSFPWRSLAASAHHRLAEESEARTLAGAELELARSWGAGSAVGSALRVAAVVGPDTERASRLRESIDALAAPESALERARSLLELGAELRRRNERRAGREVLEEGLDIAARCGAAALVARAREELLAVGARPRRDRRWGIDALTMSELRIARLAADGMSNREIAQALFVTPKTVEHHLGRCYRKLDITKRAQLAAALGHE
jgi:DNA-binding CsgD family transcriptional regulator